MTLNSIEVPYLILVQTFFLAFLVIDLYRPAMTSYPGDASSLPIQAVADEKSWVVLQVSLGMIDDQALSAKIMEMVRIPVTVVGFLFSFVRDADLMKDRLSLALNSIQVFLLEMIGKIFQGFGACTQDDLITFCQSANIR